MGIIKTAEIEAQLALFGLGQRCVRVNTAAAVHVLVGQFIFGHHRNSLYNQGMNKKEKSFDVLITKLKDMLPTLSEKYQIRTLEVFGSYVRGDEKEGSDLDLLVTFSHEPSLFRFIEIENFLSDQLDIKVDLVMKDSLKPTIGKRILEEAQTV